MLMISTLKLSILRSPTGEHEGGLLTRDLCKQTDLHWQLEIQNTGFSEVSWFLL